MQIERIDNEILIRIPANTDTVGLQRLIDFLRFKEMASKSKASDEEIEKLSEASKKSWWSSNKGKFTK